MITGKGTDTEGNPVYIVGLSEGNIRHLKNGKPMKVVMERMGVTGTIMVFYGETEDIMLEELKKHSSPVVHELDHH